MSDADQTRDIWQQRVEQRIDDLEDENESIKEENKELKTKLEQQQDGGLPNVSRRQTLAGLLGGGAMLGAAGSASAQSGNGNGGPPFADEDHDHSGDYLGEDQPVGHIDTDQLHTGDLAGVKVVGPHGYDSIQAAHDDLPQGGGQIWLTKEVAETDIVFTKWTKLVGGGAGLASGGGGGRKPRIDTSGGNGIHIKAADCTVKDVLISGDKTGGYGLKLGVDGEYRGRYTVENVAVHNKGGHGIVIAGSHLNDKLDINARNCAGDGCHIGPIGFFNENLIQRLGANRCDGHGLYIGNGNFVGNTVEMLWLEDNKDWGMYVEDGTKFLGNTFTGYGFEEVHEKNEHALYMPNVKSEGANVFHLGTIGSGEIKIDESDFASLIVGRQSEPLWRNDTPVKLGQESGYFTVSHETGDSALQIRSDTNGLIGTIDKQGNARFVGEVVENAGSLYDPFTVQQQTLTVDSDLGEVSGTDGLSISEDFSVFRGTYTNGGTVWWRWDQDYLYMAADLRDDEHVQDEPSGKMFLDDAIQAGISSGRPGETENWDELTIGLRPDGPTVFQAVQPQTPNPGVLENAEAAITRTEEGDGRAKLTVAPDSSRPYAFMSREVTVDLDETPYLSINVPITFGDAKFGSVVVDDGSEQAKFKEASTGTFTTDVAAETGWSGNKTFTVRMSAVGPGDPVYVDSIGFYESSAAETAGWEDEFTSLPDAWSVDGNLNVEIVPEGHTRYEVALPWDALTASPSDEFMSLALAVHDTDSGGDTGWVEWGGGILGGKDNGEFNLANLVDGSS